MLELALIVLVLIASSINIRLVSGVWRALYGVCVWRALYGVCVACVRVVAKDRDTLLVVFSPSPL